MKKTFIISLLLLAAWLNVQAEYHTVGDRIMTEWGEKVNPSNVWQEYPRPIMERPEWKNLNGLWQFAITDFGASQPSKYDEEILVPFCAESALSGVGKMVGKNKEMWYKRDFTVPAAWKGQNVMLNFGAVDWKCDIWVNGLKVGSHTGGYTPFGIDITPALRKGSNELLVRVWDPTDDGIQPVGKQTNNPRGIWYTPVSGIWQTVWLEPVPANHISSIKTLPDIDAATLTVDVIPSVPSADLIAEVVVKEDGKTVAKGRSVNGQPVEVSMPAGFKLWSPDSPNLYDLEIALYDNNGKLSDKVKSYAAMRKYSTREDADGIVRLQLNNKDIFHFGPLDQGWWPDGLYTAPSYDALVYDLKKTKDWGFNMIRKHIKVEPALWYTACDKMGIIVWQDMPSGDLKHGPRWQNTKWFDGAEAVRSPESEATYRKEWKEIMDCLYNYPSIGVWVPFNEAWGQFKTKEIAEWTKTNDPSRLVNPASGGNFYATGDIIDLHNYPGPAMYLFDAKRSNVLGEYGGIGYPVEGHLWVPDRNWGYITLKSGKEVTDKYIEYLNELKKMVPRGFSGAVYTQTTDVEIEVNGIMTYDRKVVKMDEDRLREANRSLVNTLGNPESK